VYGVITPVTARLCLRGWANSPHPARVVHPRALTGAGVFSEIRHTRAHTWSRYLPPVASAVMPNRLATVFGKGAKAQTTEAGQCASDKPRLAHTSDERHAVSGLPSFFGHLFLASQRKRLTSGLPVEARYRGTRSTRREGRGVVAAMCV
jgi:hypothetical protein